MRELMNTMFCQHRSTTRQTPPTTVAQGDNLLCRRLPVGEAFEHSGPLIYAKSSQVGNQVGNLRNGRLAVCAAKRACLP